MAKDKLKEALYKAEGQRRMKIRKAKRRKAFKEKYERMLTLRNSCDCGSDYYCYCGDGTPYSY